VASPFRQFIVYHTCSFSCLIAKASIRNLASNPFQNWGYANSFLCVYRLGCWRECFGLLCESVTDTPVDASGAKAVFAPVKGPGVLLFINSLS
jgi:hypothetical protein